MIDQTLSAKRLCLAVYAVFLVGVGCFLLQFDVTAGNFWWGALNGGIMLTLFSLFRLQVRKKESGKKRKSFGIRMIWVTIFLSFSVINIFAGHVFGFSPTALAFKQGTFSLIAAGLAGYSMIKSPSSAKSENGG